MFYHKVFCMLVIFRLLVYLGGLHQIVPVGLFQQHTTLQGKITVKVFDGQGHFLVTNLAEVQTSAIWEKCISRHC